MGEMVGRSFAGLGVWVRGWGCLWAWGMDRDQRGWWSTLQAVTRHQDASKSRNHKAIKSEAGAMLISRYKHQVAVPLHEKTPIQPGTELNASQDSTRRIAQPRPCQSPMLFSGRHEGKLSETARGSNNPRNLPSPTILNFIPLLPLR